MKSWDTKIYVGFEERDTGIIHSLEECASILQDYCDSKGLCVTLTPTTFIYTKGSEPGAIIGLIQYLRFPKEEWELRDTALEIAKILLDKLNQYRVTINFPKEVVMLSNETLLSKI